MSEALANAVIIKMCQAILDLLDKSKNNGRRLTLNEKLINEQKILLSITRLVRDFPVDCLVDNQLFNARAYAISALFNLKVGNTDNATAFLRRCQKTLQGGVC